MCLYFDILFLIILMGIGNLVCLRQYRGVPNCGESLAAISATWRSACWVLVSACLQTPQASPRDSKKNIYVYIYRCI